MLMLLFGLALQTAAVAATLTIEVPNLRSVRGEVRGAVFRSDAGFPKRPEMAYRRAVGVIDGRRARITFEGLEPGTYAVVVVHDENRNGKLDTGFMGIPKEGYGFSRNAKGRLGPPSFDAARFPLGASPAAVMTISLQY